MTVFMVPGVFGAGAQILDQNGNPISGALINTYAAGTTSPVAVFTTVNGNVTASNPVVANADGRLPYELWQTQGQAIKIVLTDAVGNTLGPYDNLQGINDLSVILSTTNTWTAPQTFSSAYILSLSANNIQVTSITTSTLTVSSVASFLNVVNWAQATAIPTISSINVATANGNFVDLTGTNTVTSLGVVSAGAIRFIRFSSVVPILSSVSQIIPTGATITSVTGDTAIAISLGAGNWQLVNYQRKDGSGLATTTPTAAQGSSLVLLSTLSAVSSATVDFTSNLDSTFDMYKFVIKNVLPNTDNTGFNIQVSENAGGAWKSGGSDYEYANIALRSDATAVNRASSADSLLALYGSSLEGVGGGGGLNDGWTGEILFSLTGTRKHFTWFANYVPGTTTVSEHTSGGGVYKGTTNAINGIRFIMGSGFIQSGIFRLYGIKNS